MYEVRSKLYNTTQREVDTLKKAYAFQPWSFGQPCLNLQRIPKPIDPIHTHRDIHIYKYIYIYIHIYVFIHMCIYVGMFSWARTAVTRLCCNREAQRGSSARLPPGAKGRAGPPPPPNGGLPFRGVVPR